MDIVEHLVRSFARRISKDGAVAIISNGHPALVAAFAHLGWSDPYLDPTLLPPPPPPVIESVAIPVIEPALTDTPTESADGDDL